jgi:signal transduction histidine kinase
MVRKSNKEVKNNFCLLDVEKEAELKNSIVLHGILMITLTFTMCLIFLYNIYSVNKSSIVEKQRIMAQLVNDNPELEANIIKAFHLNEANKSNTLYEKGQMLDNKYGYREKDMIQRQMKAGFSQSVFVVIGISICILYVYITYHIHKKSFYTLYKGLHDMKDALDKMISGDYKVIHWEEEKLIKSNSIHEILDKLKRLGLNYISMNEKLLHDKLEVERLITDIAHQLKTPLASLKMSFEIVGSEGFTEEEKTEFLIHGKEEVDKLYFLTDTLTRLSRLEAGMIHIKKDSEDILATIKNAINSIYSKAYEKNISISVDVTKVGNVPHDGKWTEEAFVNVLDNAVKYSDHNTNITIHITQMVSYVLIEIMDEGIGISKKEYNEIFKRFYRGTSKRVKDTEGGGVGLYLVRHILEEQGGTVRVKSNREKGSNFQMTLPM